MITKLRFITYLISTIHVFKISNSVTPPLDKLNFNLNIEDSPVNNDDLIRSSDYKYTNLPNDTQSFQEESFSRRSKQDMTPALATTVLTDPISNMSNNKMGNKLSIPKFESLIVAQISNGCPTGNSGNYYKWGNTTQNTGQDYNSTNVTENRGNGYNWENFTGNIDNDNNWENSTGNSSNDYICGSTTANIGNDYNWGSTGAMPRSVIRRGIRTWPSQAYQRGIRVRPRARSDFSRGIRAWPSQAFGRGNRVMPRPDFIGGSGRPIFGPRLFESRDAVVIPRPRPDGSVENRGPVFGKRSFGVQRAIIGPVFSRGLVGPVRNRRPVEPVGSIGTGFEQRPFGFQDAIDHSAQAGARSPFGRGISAWNRPGLTRGIIRTTRSDFGDSTIDRLRPSGIGGPVFMPVRHGNDIFRPGQIPSGFIRPRELIPGQIPVGLARPIPVRRGQIPIGSSRPRPFIPGQILVGPYKPRSVRPGQIPAGPAKQRPVIPEQKPVVQARQGLFMQGQIPVGVDRPRAVRPGQIIIGPARPRPVSTGQILAGQAVPRPVRPGQILVRPARPRPVIPGQISGRPAKPRTVRPGQISVGEAIPSPGGPGQIPVGSVRPRPVMSEQISRPVRPGQQQFRPAMPRPIIPGVVIIRPGQCSEAVTGTGADIGPLYNKAGYKQCMNKCQHMWGKRPKGSCYFFPDLKSICRCIKSIECHDTCWNNYDGCKTYKAWKNNAMIWKRDICVFPFKNKDKTYNECIIDSGNPWCATQVDDERKYVEWGYCEYICHVNKDMNPRVIKIKGYLDPLLVEEYFKKWGSMFRVKALMHIFQKIFNSANKYLKKLDRGGLIVKLDGVLNNLDREFKIGPTYINRANNYEIESLEKQSDVKGYAFAFQEAIQKSNFKQTLDTILFMFKKQTESGTQTIALEDSCLCETQTPYPCAGVMGITNARPNFDTLGKLLAHEIVDALGDLEHNETVGSIMAETTMVEKWSESLRHKISQYDTSCLDKEYNEKVDTIPDIQQAWNLENGAIVGDSENEQAMTSSETENLNTVEEKIPVENGVLSPDLNPQVIKIKVYLDPSLVEEYKNQFGGMFRVMAATKMLRPLLKSANRYLKKLDGGGFMVEMVGNIDELDNSPFKIEPNYTNRANKDEIMLLKLHSDTKGYAFVFQEAIKESNFTQDPDTILFIFTNQTENRSQTVELEDNCLCKNNISHPCAGVVAINNINPEIDTLGKLLAHEIGDAFGALEQNEVDSTIMSETTAAKDWSQSSKDKINEHDTSCLKKIYSEYS